MPLLERYALVIEHEPLIRNLIANLLAIKEITSHQAATEEEAIAMLTQYKYNLILLDLMLPDENGFAVLDQIRSRYPDRTQHTVLTTSGDAKFLAHLPQDGWCATLVKPFTISEFYRIAELCLGGNHAGGVCYN